LEEELLNDTVSTIKSGLSTKKTQKSALKMQPTKKAARKKGK